MYEYISGNLHSKFANSAVIDVGGVGYRIITSQNSLAGVQLGDNVTFYTYLHVREDVFDLYGFSSCEERAAFEMLLTISGVGPRAALNILSALTHAELAIAIVCGDSKAITKAVGVGAKLASRIVLELKDKITKEQMNNAGGTSNIQIPVQHTTQSDAESALVVLGYTADAARKAVVSVAQEGMKTDDIIRKALAELQ